MHEGCIFCGIVAGDIPSTTVAESDNVVAFRDINPAAPVHVLLIPKTHVVSSAAELRAGHGELLGELFELAASIAEAEGLEGTYRVIVNSGAGSGQTVFHLHFHLLGGWGRSGSYPKTLGDETGGVPVS